MNETSGRIIHLSEENKPIAGCTVSKQVYSNNGYSIYVFSLSNNTEISAESYEYYKLFMLHDGEMIFFDINGNERCLNKGECVITPLNIPIGVKTQIGSVYTEIGFRKDTTMNDILKSGEVFKLGELVPYQDGKIINMDLINESKLKLVVMSFYKGTGLSEHAAPGEALVFALDGEAIIGYEGKDFPLKAGETFKFDKLGKHSVTATNKFKMALLLVLE